MQTYTLGLLLPASAALTDVPKELRWRLAISLEANVDLFDVRLFSDRDDFVCPFAKCLGLELWIARAHVHGLAGGPELVHARLSVLLRPCLPLTGPNPSGAHCPPRTGGRTKPLALCSRGRRESSRS